MLNRFVIPTIEGRIFTGITMFVAIMILIGWVAINEPARMASFTEQHTGRSIESGAALFASRCSTCHGTDSYGIAERAPGLNNPMLFGHNFFQPVNDNILKLEREVAELNIQLEELNTERTALTTEAGSADLTDARRQQINTRLAEIDALTGVEGDTSIPAQITQHTTELQPLYAERDKIIDSLSGAGGPIEKGYLPELAKYQAEGGIALTNYINQDSNRLAQVAWGGDVRNYIKTTLIHGRPGSDRVWPQPMVAWSQLAGGPLRDDQLDDIVDFLVNYNKGDGWTLEDLASVNQFAKLYGDTSGGGSTVPAVGNDAKVADAIVEAMVGDPARGETLYKGESKTELNKILGCKACHLEGAQAPLTAGTWDRVVTDRLTQPQFAGYTPEHYLIESILQPNAYIVPSYASGLMPEKLGERMSAKDLADIVAYLHSTSDTYVKPDPSTITPLTTAAGAAPAAPAAVGTAETMPMMGTAEAAPAAMSPTAPTAEATVPVAVEPGGTPAPQATGAGS